MVAGTIGGSQYGVAKGVALIAVKVLGCGGSQPGTAVLTRYWWPGADHISSTTHPGGGYVCRRQPRKGPQHPASRRAPALPAQIDSDRFTSLQANCENQVTEALLGHLLL